jgi:hypothetical protein
MNRAINTDGNSYRAAQQQRKPKALEDVLEACDTRRN